MNSQAGSEAQLAPSPAYRRDSSGSAYYEKPAASLSSPSLPTALSQDGATDTYWLPQRQRRMCCCDSRWEVTKVAVETNCGPRRGHPLFRKQFCWASRWLRWSLVSGKGYRAESAALEKSKNILEKKESKHADKDTNLKKKTPNPEEQALAPLQCTPLHTEEGPEAAVQLSAGSGLPNRRAEELPRATKQSWLHLCSRSDSLPAAMATSGWQLRRANRCCQRGSSAPKAGTGLRARQRSALLPFEPTQRCQDALDKHLHPI